MDYILAVSLMRWCAAYATYQPEKQKKFRKSLMLVSCHSFCGIVGMWFLTSTWTFSLFDGFDISDIQTLQQAYLASCVYFTFWMFDLASYDSGVSPMRWNKWLHHIGCLVGFPLMLWSGDVKVFEYAVLVGTLLQFEGLLCEGMKLTHYFLVPTGYKAYVFGIGLMLKVPWRISYCVLPVVRYIGMNGLDESATCLSMSLFLLADHSYDDYVFYQLKRRFAIASRVSKTASAMPSGDAGSAASQGAEVPTLLEAFKIRTHKDSLRMIAEDACSESPRCEVRRIATV